MNKEDANGKFIMGPEIRVHTPRFMDRLTVRLAAAGLIMYEAFRHPLTDGVIVMDFAKRTATVGRKQKGVTSE